MNAKTDLFKVSVAVDQKVKEEGGGRKRRMRSKGRLSKGVQIRLFFCLLVVG